MKSKYNSEQAEAVESAVKHFEHWRATTERGRRRMSEELRAIAIDLSYKIGVHPASKELGLNCTDLKRWRQKAKDLENGTFTEVKLLPTMGFSCRVKIIKNDTHVNIAFEDSNVAQVTALIKGVL
jgi:hypothetical protein